MAFKFPKPLDAQIEENMRNLYETLSEKDRRRFAALQAQQLGHGAIKYLADVLGCSRRTIERGLLELNQLPNDPALGRVRRLGAGRKKKLHLSPYSNRI
jgi:hypothetical protein